MNLENGFMTASIYHPDDKHDQGLTTEEHGFANPDAQWEGDYGDSNWD